MVSPTRLGGGLKLAELGSSGAKAPNERALNAALKGRSSTVIPARHVIRPRHSFAAFLHGIPARSFFRGIPARSFLRAHSFAAAFPTGESGTTF